MNKTSLVLVAALLLSGCAAPTQPSAMTSTTVLGAVHRSDSALSVFVTGGKETSAMGASQISNEAFTQAITDSIRAAGLFSGVGDANARYQLNAFIARVSQPMVGFSMRVTMEVSYTLVDSTTKKTVWEKSILSDHTAAASEAFAGVKRLQLATEGAAKQNVEMLVRYLADLKLD